MTTYFQIHYFSSASSYTGKSTEQLPAPLPLSQLFSTLESKYPGIRDKVLNSCSVSLGDEYVDVHEEGEGEKEEEVKGGSGDGEQKRITIIVAGDEVAIIPPVSSG